MVNVDAWIAARPLAFFVMTGEVVLIGAFSFLAYKVYQDRQRIGMPVLRALLAVVVCFIIWALVVTMRPLDVWQRVVAAGCAQYGAFLYYVAIRRMFKNERPHALIRNKGFWITLLVVGILVVLDIQLRGQASLDSSAPYISGWLSNTEAALSYLYLLFLDVLIIKVYLKGLQRSTHLVDQGRFGLCLFAFSMNLLGLLLMEVSLLLVILNHQEYRDLINLLYHVSLVVFVLFTVVSYILPERFFVRVLRPLSIYTALRQKRQQALLRDLHQTMVRIVPGVQLPCESVHDLRILIEISDARQIIWSLQQRLKPIKPQEEAKYLWQLMHKNTVLEAPGKYSPAPTYLKNIVKHNVMVAKQLQRLQGIT